MFPADCDTLGLAQRDGRAGVRGKVSPRQDRGCDPDHRHEQIPEDLQGGARARRPREGREASARRHPDRSGPTGAAAGA